MVVVTVAATVAVAKAATVVATVAPVAKAVVATPVVDLALQGVVAAQQPPEIALVATVCNAPLASNPNYSRTLSVKRTP